MEVALDYALQCSPDHPWVQEHPEWFHRRPDGTIKYAENPPKKYQDIYPLNFASEDGAGCGTRAATSMLHWSRTACASSASTTRTRSRCAFWEWLIGDVRARHPDVIFLAEAFTRPAMMATLAKVGFSQTYTYFTWRNTRPSSGARWREIPLARVLPAELLREHAGHPPRVPATRRATRLRRAARARRDALAVYGIYSGFERFENEPVRRAHRVPRLGEVRAKKRSSTARCCRSCSG